MNFVQLSVLAFLVHLANSLAVLITALTADKTLKLPLTLTRFGGPPGSFELDEVKVLWNVPLWALVFTFSALAMVDHAAAAWLTLGMGDGNDLRTPFTDARDFLIAGLMWFEYTFSASIMMVTILLLSGVTDLFTILMVITAMFGSFSATMKTDANLYYSASASLDGSRSYGDFMAIQDIDARFRSGLFWVGSELMLVPWIIVFASLFMANPPGFVYAIVFTLFLLFCPFAVVQNYYVGMSPAWFMTNVHRRTRALVWCSILAKTALVWQIYANALVL